MSVAEGILIVIVILLIGYIYVGRGEVKTDVSTPTDTMMVYPQRPKEKTYEEKAADSLKEQYEYFQVCKDGDEISRTLDCTSGDSEKHAFAEYDYGQPGMDYNEFMTSQGVDDQAIKYHKQFVQDREGFGTTGEWTGRTWSPDSHDSYDPIPWVGLRRPEYTTQCNPTQVPDIDINLYKGNRNWCFKT